MSALAYIWLLCIVGIGAMIVFCIQMNAVIAELRRIGDALEDLK